MKRKVITIKNTSTWRMSSGGQGDIREPKYCSDGNLVGEGDFVFNTDTH